MKIGKQKQTTKQVEATEYKPVPKGTYQVELKSIEEKQTKNGTGAYLDSVFIISTGDHMGRLVFHKFLIKHSNEKAASIGQEQLDKFLKSIGEKNGLEGIDYDTGSLADFIGATSVANIAIEQQEGYSARNKITSFLRR